MNARTRIAVLLALLPMMVALSGPAAAAPQRFPGEAEPNRSFLATISAVVGPALVFTDDQVVDHWFGGLEGRLTWRVVPEFRIGLRTLLMLGQLPFEEDQYEVFHHGELVEDRSEQIEAGGQLGLSALGSLGLLLEARPAPFFGVFVHGGFQWILTDHYSFLSIIPRPHAGIGLAFDVFQNEKIGGNLTVGLDYTYVEQDLEQHLLMPSVRFGLAF